MQMVTTMGAAMLGAFVFERLRVPAGALIGAMIAVAALNLSAFDVGRLPGSVRFLSFAAIGWILGQQFTRDSLDSLRSSIVPILVVVGGLLMASVVIVFALRAMGVDLATAFLAASPGGISQMAAISVEVGANAPVVATAHLIRVITVVLMAPIVARFLVE